MGDPLRRMTGVGKDKGRRGGALPAQRPGSRPGVERLFRRGGYWRIASLNDSGCSVCWARSAIQSITCSSITRL